MGNALKEELTLTCPLCQGEHTYPLKVKRNFIIGLMTAGGSVKSRRVRFTRLFTCPVTSEDFKAGFSLIETNLDKIQRVEVEEPEERNGEGED